MNDVHETEKHQSYWPIATFHHTSHHHVFPCPSLHIYLLLLITVRIRVYLRKRLFSTKIFLQNI